MYTTHLVDHVFQKRTYKDDITYINIHYVMKYIDVDMEYVALDIAKVCLGRAMHAIYSRDTVMLLITLGMATVGHNLTWQRSVIAVFMTN